MNTPVQVDYFYFLRTNILKVTPFVGPTLTKQQFQIFSLRETLFNSQPTLLDSVTIPNLKQIIHV